MQYELKTIAVKGQFINIKTNIGTLKQVWNILKEVNLDGLLTGGQLELSFSDLIDALLLKGSLDKFISIICDDLKTDVESLELSDVVGIITFFFTSIAQPFQDLNISLSLPRTE
jgi:hypothetical protein